MRGNPFMDALARSMVDDDDSDRRSPAVTDLALPDELRRRFALSQQKHDFKPGDLVCEKPGLSMYKDGDKPHVVMEVGTSGMPAFEPIRPGGNLSVPDMIIGQIDRDGDFSRFAVESWRFQPFAE